jgi:hypothetical protein
MGYGPVAQAVVDRSCSALEPLLKSGKSPDEGFEGQFEDSYVYDPLNSFMYNESNEIPHLFPPLCLALGWTPGFELLLRYGANPSLAIISAIRFSEDKAIELLVEHDVPLSVGRFESIVLDDIKGSRLEDATINLILPKGTD